MTAAKTTKNDPKSRASYWRLWTDNNSVSHHDQCALTDCHLKQVGDAVGQWNNEQLWSETTVARSVQPGSSLKKRHQNSTLRWIVVLNGGWWIKSMDGMKIEQGSDEFSLAEDQYCGDTDGRWNHRWDASCGDPEVLKTAQLHLDPVRFFLSRC